MNGSILATIAIGISSISIVVIFEVTRDILVLQDKLAKLQLDDRSLRKSSRLIRINNTYVAIFVLSFLVGSISSLVSTILLTKHLNILPMEFLENSTHYLLLFCSVMFIFMFSLVCIKLYPKKLYKND